MSMSTFQKVTLVSCLVLCASLLLPKMLLSRGKKEVGQPEGKASKYPVTHLDSPIQMTTVKLFSFENYLAAYITAARYY